MFIDALMAKNYPLPIKPETKISDLSVDPLPIVILINEVFFPDNRFTTEMISAGDTIQSVSLTILKKGPANI
jgi:hypothetical protein